MDFNVSGLIQEGIGATREYRIDGSVDVDGRAVSVAGRVELLRTIAGVLVRARLDLAEPETCSRCLKPIEDRRTIEFEEEFQSTVDARSGELVDEERDPDAFIIDEHHTLDLTDAIRQYREVSTAMQALCKADCRGLCARCGQDLNLGDCGCEPDTIDSRWADLAPISNWRAEGKE
jgi:uncharacterized protein